MYGEALRLRLESLLQLSCVMTRVVTGVNCSFTLGPMKCHTHANKLVVRAGMRIGKSIGVSPHMCDEYSPVTLHYMTLYMYSLLNPIRTFPSDGCKTWVRRYFNIHKGFDAYCTTNTSWYVQVRTVNLISQMTRLSEVSDAA
jgi:hypothetical protein